MDKELSQLKKKLRQALAEYMLSEGCTSCCGNHEKHNEAKARLGKLLNVKKYEDKSGYDFYSYQSK